MEGQANYVEKKDQEEPIVLLAYKGESKEKSTDILTPKQTITRVVSKTCLWSLMNQKVAMLLLEMHKKF